MQPVQFSCGHCGNLMAVGSDHLGLQVRCPHCQQVVLAPPPVDSPPQLVETILYSPPPPGDGENIFSQTEGSDDLFGRHESPRVEMPPEPFAPTLPGDNDVPPPQPEGTLSSTLPFVPSSPFPPADGAAAFPSSEATAPWLAPTEMLTPPAVEAPPSFLSESPADSSPPLRRQRSSEAKVPWFLILVFSPLLLYAIVITVFSVMLYREVQDRDEKLQKRFEVMPDEGDNPGVQKGKKVSRRWPYDPKLPTQPLPENLCMTLGQGEPLRIGALQVKPIRVERKRVKVVVEKSNPEPCRFDSLVLYLNLKNVSDDYAFAPLDNYFDRCYRGGEQPPFTLLEVGDKARCYGGPAYWYPQGDGRNKREWVEGRDDLPALLQPGESKEYFVCTNGYDEQSVSVLFGGKNGESFHGSFLWRIRVRRGLVRYNAKDHSVATVLGARGNDKDRPATAVIGVRFSAKDIRQAARETR